MKIKYKNTASDNIFDISVYTILIFSFLIVAYPLYFVAISSISDPNIVNTGGVTFYQRGVNFEGYKLIFQDPRILGGYKNTIIYSFGFSVLSVAMSMMTAFALSRGNLVGRRVINLFFIITLYFGGGLIPLYIVVQKLGMINKPVSMWILGSLVVFHIIIARTYFETSIPEELVDSSNIDGCNQAQYFFRIALTLCKPIIAVLTLYSFVGQWNSFFIAMIFMNESKYHPLQLVLHQILLATQQLQTNISIDNAEAMSDKQKLAELIKYGVIIVASVPLLVVYPFLQKYFVQGIMVGSVKG